MFLSRLPIVGVDYPLPDSSFGRSIHPPAELLKRVAGDSAVRTSASEDISWTAAKLEVKFHAILTPSMPGGRHSQRLASVIQYPGKL